MIRNDRPMISIVMPVHNGGKYLKSAVNDILCQTDTDFEFIAVEDGSEDKSRAFLQNTQLIHKQLKVICQDNMGGGSARNTGLAEARGRYVLFLDDDDRFEHTLVEELKEQLNRLNPDILVFGGDRFHNGMSKTFASPALLCTGVLSEESQEKKILTEYDCQNAILKFTNTTVWNKVFRKDFLIKHHIMFQSNPGNDTLSFTLTALCCAQKIGYYEKILVHYQEGNPEGQIANQDKWPTSIYKALLYGKEALELRGKLLIYKSAFVRYAVQKCMSRLEMIQSFNGQRELYQLLHDYGIQKLGLTEKELKESGAEMYIDKISRIRMYSYEEYLYKRFALIQGTGLLCRTVYRLPELGIEERARVVLYGCGNVGKSYYIQLINQKKYRIVLWVAPDYEQILFCVSSVEQIFTAGFDYIVLAEEDEASALNVKEFLISRGIDDNKIIWTPPEII